LGKYAQYQAIAQQNKNVENENLKGLIHALTPKTSVEVSFESKRHNIANAKQISPK
jgi:hypothetical protein